MGWLDALAGFAFGILSGFGIGGGNLLMLYMTELRGVDQLMAGGINLLYFLPNALGSLISHFRAGLISLRDIWPAIAAGTVCSVLTAFWAQGIDKTLLRQLFGALLVYVGVRELMGTKSVAVRDGQ